MGVQRRVVIGMDPHKRSVTVEVMEADERIVGHCRFGTDVAGFAELVGFAGQWADRVWAIEGCEGIGRHVAQRLLAAGEQVVDVPAKLSARMRMFATGQGRKTDDTDAHSIALVGVRISGLQPVVSDDQLEMLRLLVDRRRRIGQEHVTKICQLHQLLLELVPGGAKKDLSAAQARKILAGVRPGDEVGKLRKRIALELVVDLERIYLRKKQANKELVTLLKTTGTGLVDLHGIGPTGAARLLVEVGDITRFPNRGHFASWTGQPHRCVLRGPTTPPALPRREPPDQHGAPHDGRRSAPQPHRRTRLLRPESGRREEPQRGHALPEATPVRHRLSSPARRLRHAKATGPGGHRGTTHQSSVAGSHPHTSTSDKPLPGPVTTKPTTTLPKAS